MDRTGADAVLTRPAASCWAGARGLEAITRKQLYLAKWRDYPARAFPASGRTSKGPADTRTVRAVQFPGHAFLSLIMYVLICEVSTQPCQMQF